MDGEPTIYAKFKMSFVILNNEFLEAKYISQHIVPIVLEGDAKIEHGNKWREISWKDLAIKEATRKIILCDTRSVHASATI